MAAEVAKKAARQLPKSFKLGQKQVFLPNHVITFLRKEHLPPNEACFKVPLRFTKFDLRDYLWNLYNVEVKKVRSYVKQLPLTQRDSHTRAWYRPQPQKIMTVVLSEQFQWPDVPEDAAPWSNDLFKKREELTNSRNEEQINMSNFDIPLKSKQPLSPSRKALAQLANKLSSGEVKWTNSVVLDEKWNDLLAREKEAAEVPTETAETSKGENVTKST